MKSLLYIAVFGQGSLGWGNTLLSSFQISHSALLDTEPGDLNAGVKGCLGAASARVQSLIF